MENFKFIQKSKLRHIIPPPSTDLTDYVNSDLGNETPNIGVPAEEQAPTEANTAESNSISQNCKISDSTNVATNSINNHLKQEKLNFSKLSTGSNVEHTNNLSPINWYIDPNPTPSSSGCSTIITINQKKKRNAKPKEESKKRKRKTTYSVGTSNPPFTKKKGKYSICVTKHPSLIDIDDKVPTYKTNSKDLRGNVLLINNISFTGEDYRDGAKIDQSNMTTLFTQMGFKVTEHVDLNAKRMKDTITDYSRQKFHGDIQIVIIMSHGNDDGKSFVRSLDERKVYTEWIVDQFSNTTCTSLAGKPKIFIIQACRGSKQMIEGKESTDNVDTYVPSSKCKKADVLIARSTVSGYVSYRNGTSGSRFVESICHVFAEHAYDTHVEDLLKMVNAKINNLKPNTRSYQTPVYENRNFKRCYLNPINLDLSLLEN